MFGTLLCKILTVKIVMQIKNTEYGGVCKWYVSFFWIPGLAYRAAVKLLENIDGWKRPISMWQRNCYKCLFVLAYFKHQLKICPIWIPGKASCSSWFLSKKDIVSVPGISSLTLLSSVNKWQKELSNLKVYLIRGIYGYRWSTWSLVSFANISFAKIQDLEAGMECVWQEVFPFTAALVVPLFLSLDKICRTFCSCPTTVVLMVPSCSGLFCAFQDG